MLNTQEPRSSIYSTTEQPVQKESDEVGTVVRATRIPRAVSRRSSFSSEILLRPSSRSSTVSSLITAFSPPAGEKSAISSNGSQARDRSSTAGSITSEGFRNMIASNRNSWAPSEFGNDSGALSPTEAQHETTLPLSIRSVNRLDGNKLSGNDLDKKEKQKVGDRPVTPTITYTPPGRGSKTSTTQQDDNVPPSPTPRRQQQQRVAEPAHQRSIPSLRYKPSGLMSMR